MNVYEEAHDLARAIRESEEFKEYDSLKKKIEADPELAGMIHDFEQKQVEMQARTMAGEAAPEGFQQQMQKLYQIVMRDPSAAAYMQAAVRFSLMINDVYQILGDAMGFSIGKPQ